MAVNNLDKYYTPDWLVKYHIKKTIEIIGKENITDIVEGAAGDGAYIEALREAFPDHYIELYDLYPEHPDVIKQDFKLLRKSYKKGCLSIGNPPYGNASSLWRMFCKKSSTFADYISFISPTSQYKSNYHFRQGELVYSELLKDVKYRGSKTENGKDHFVKTCLNIYKVYDREEEVDSRDERLDQDVEIKQGNHNNADFYLGRWGGGPSCKYSKERIWNHEPYCIRILNENKRKEITDFFKSFYDNYRKKIEQINYSAPLLSLFYLKKELKKHLYPTREERLEQDIKIYGTNKNEKTNAHFHLKRMCNGSGNRCGEYDPNRLQVEAISIEILNENIRNKIEQFCISFEDKYGEELKQGTGHFTLTKPFLKNKLKKHLYGQEECDEYENKIPIKVERALYCVQLF